MSSKLVHIVSSCYKFWFATAFPSSAGNVSVIPSWPWAVGPANWGVPSLISLLRIPQSSRWNKAENHSLAISPGVGKTHRQTLPAAGRVLTLTCPNFTMYLGEEIWNFGYHQFLCHFAVKLWLASFIWWRKLNTWWKPLYNLREIHPLEPERHRHSMLAPRVCAPRVTRCSLGHVIWSVQLACSILSRSDSCQGDGRQRHLMMHGQCPIPVYSSQITSSHRQLSRVPWQGFEPRLKVSVLCVEAW